MDQVVRLAKPWFRRRVHDRIMVLGGGKAGAAMTVTLRQELLHRGIDDGRIQGIVNVPNDTVVPIRGLDLWPARPGGTNQPTEEAARGTERILELAEAAAPNDLLLCLISGGGSALMPAPVPGVSLADKRHVTALLHRCGATIQEMNTVRKHLSRIKGGGLVRHFAGRLIISLIISDVIGDPLDVIASGPTCVDPTTFSDALAVLAKFKLTAQVPKSALAYLRRGAAGKAPETLKALPVDERGKPRVDNLIIANNPMALEAAQRKAAELGYRVVNLGACIQGETRSVAGVLADVACGQPPGVCVLSGGETTVTLPKNHGLGGRNQEFVLAFLCSLSRKRLGGITVLSGGTDGEDGPTDAAGAFGDADLMAAAERLGLDAADYLDRHDAYHFFEQVGGLLTTGLTRTNVMDLRVILT
jgi:hydroxypyruvate reductase/glycerate 2-kinase